MGKTKHKDQIYEGQHEGIISEDVFEKVQEVMKEKGNNTAGKRKAKTEFLLHNKVYFGNEKMKHASGKKLHYFKHEGTYIRIDAIDETVMKATENFIHAKETGLTKLESENLMYVDFKKLSLSNKHGLIKHLAKQIVFENKEDLRIILNRTAVSDLKRWTGLERQKETSSLENIYVKDNEVIIRTKLKPNEHKSKIEGFVENKKLNLETVEALVKGWHYRKEYETGKTLFDLEKEEHVSRRTIRRHMNLAYLSPKIVGKILDGDLRCGLLELEKASSYLEWNEQERSVGL
ncbi:MAG: hypothetical protein JW812_03455 [Alphaproteobacteria bacterium]|nr:hypothetical protein [Alphaproteobacteria bacterium]MBN2780261.1 hypothetical protein [Alphaproteobacteria bacterium]